MPYHKDSCMKKRKIFSSIIAITLSLVLTFSCFSTTALASSLDIMGILSGAGVGSSGNIDILRIFLQALNKITTEKDSVVYTDRAKGSKEVTADMLAEYQAQIDEFNSYVNQIKALKPSYKITANQGLPTDGGTSASIMGTVGTVTSLIEVLSGLLFGTDNTIHASRLVDLLGLDSLFSEIRKSEVERGQDSTNLISVAGEQYVSALTASDIYEIDYTKSRYGGMLIKAYLYDCLNPTKSDAQGRVYNLLNDTKFYEALASFAPNVSFDMIRIKYVDCYVELTVNKNGHVTNYNTHYKCVLDIDEEAGKISGIDMTSLLSLSETVLYESSVYYSNFNWNPRPAGDVDDNDRVTAADARLALRSAAKLYIIPEESVAFIYADVNKDKKITAADARMILRAAAGLELLPEI